MAPFCVSVPPQSDWKVCPLGHVHVSVQLVQAVVPVLLMVMVPPKEPALPELLCEPTLHPILHAMPVAAVTVREIVVLAVAEPEVPVMVIVDVPAAAVLAAVSVRLPLEVDGFEVHVAVTPAGSPEAARVTEPLNGLISVMLIVSGLLEPAASDSVGAEGVSTKLPVAGAAVTVRAIVVDAVSVPEVPVMVMVLVVTAAVFATVKMIPLVPVVGLASNTALTPVGRFETARVTAPVNPFAPSTLMVSLAVSF